MSGVTETVICWKMGVLDVVAMLADVKSSPHTARP
jgi:hypothetical protein